MLDQLMGTCYLIQGQSRRCRVPANSPQCLAESASGFDLCFGWHIVAADEEDSCVYKHKLPDRNFRCRRIGGIRRNGPALCQQLRISLDVRSESDFYDVMKSIEGKTEELRSNL
jgi:hypothetical protein